MIVFNDNNAAPKATVSPIDPSKIEPLIINHPSGIHPNSIGKQAYLSEVQRLEQAQLYQMQK